MDIKGIKITKSMYIFILCSFVYNLLLSLMYTDSKDINTLIINIYGNIDLLNLNYIAKIILWILPQIIIVKYLGNFFEENLLNNTSIIFTRTSKRSYFFAKNIFNLFINLSIICSIQVICIIIISMITKIPVSINFITFLTIFRIILYYFLMLLIIIGLSVLCKSINIVYIVMLIKVSMVYLSGMLLEYYNLIIKHLPINIGIISINDLGMGMFNIEAIIYCLLYIIFFSILTMFLFRKKEFLN